MNILILTPDYPPNIHCGIGAHVYHLVNNLSGLCDQITVVVLRTHYITASEYVEEIQGNIRIIQFKELEHNTKIYSKVERVIYNNLKALDSIPDILTGYEYDLVHIHEVYPCIIYDHIQRVLKLPAVSTIHAMTSGADTIIDAFRRYLRISPRAVITVSNALKNACIQRYGAEVSFPEIQVISNGISMNKNVHCIDKEYIIVFCGRLVSVKGCDTLLKAFAELRKSSRFSQFFLHIIGEGEEKGNLQSLVKQLQIDSHVIFEGHLHNEKVREIMGRARFLVMPSLYEGCPITVLEAMAEGTCVICTDVGGLPELVVDGYNGLIVPVNDVLSLKNKMEYLLESETICEDLSKNAFETAKKYQWEEIAIQVFNIYQKAINEALLEPCP
ncbi:glycosyltransferase family 4 protein [Lacrimispora sp.]|uniref:glycosyltransferase family 4 protein n=1 Tax=Lacrimispora sp. TaxID=2719234 RepID=UPI00289829C4|nr:glycosyltransferase family 4 protein [Lacrimispora sp.]